MMAYGASRTYTNPNLGGASVLYAYFSSNGNRFVGADNITMPVPEPSVLSLLAIGLCVILRQRRRSA
ncbi:PEP-CTERM sorting domain-containing protein [bacterium]|nr:PEP-CTERM sorting domain-containing protein [bacterium]